MGVPAWNKSHLLSLPKELRLEIWRWVLTDPSVPDLVVNVGRAKAALHRRTVAPRVTTWLEPGRHCTIGLELLRTNRFIYEEALPVLYKSVKFAPADHQGIFPLFLDSLPSHARSLIQHVKLHIPRQVYDTDPFGDPAVPLFHWAVTCAQIAKLDDQLRDVEVEGLWANIELLGDKTRRSILYPLCKIKTPKVLGQNNASGMFHLLVEAQRELMTKSLERKLEALSLARRVNRQRMPSLFADAFTPAARIDTPETEAEIRAFVQIAKKRWEAGDRENEKDFLSFKVKVMREQLELSPRNRLSPPAYSVDGHTINRDLSREPGVDVSAKELDEHPGSPSSAKASSADDREGLLEDWDVVSYASGTSTPRGRPHSSMSSHSSSSWIHAASTMMEAEM